MALYHSARADGTYARKFWFDEYRLNSAIGRFPKPYVAVMDGIVMGGGVGVSALGNVRVVTEKTKLGMPEVGIGFIPDVGGTFLLSRAPGGLGLHAALTGAPFSGADAIALGFADHFVPQNRSPIALSVTLESIRRAARLETLEDVLIQEYRVSCASARSHDFVEGIRAQLVDKDRNPAWSPADLSAVTANDIESYFAPADPDLTF